MKKTQYRYIYDDFVEKCPGLAKIVESWVPHGLKSIRVDLSDGSSIIYNYALQGVRTVRANDGSEDDWRRDFRDILVEKMADHEYTQATLAHALGVSQTCISKYLNKQTMPNGYVLSKMAKLFDCTPNDLIWFED